MLLKNSTQLKIISHPKDIREWVFPAFLLLIVALMSGCSGQKVESSWVRNPIVINGIADEWEAYPAEYQEKFDLLYAAANDDHYLNLMLQFRDRRLARKMDTRGVVLWLNGEGEKKKDFGIRYIDENATPPDFSQMKEFRRNGFSGEDTTGSMPPSLLKGSFSLITGNDTLSIPAGGLEGLEAAAGFQDGVYGFEYRIPLAARRGEEIPHAIGLEKGKNIKIGLEIAAVSEEVREQMKEQMAARRPEGDVSPRGGMPPGEGMMGKWRRPGNMQSDLEAQEAWVTLLLAEKAPAGISRKLRE